MPANFGRLVAVGALAEALEVRSQFGGLRRRGGRARWPKFALTAQAGINDHLAFPSVPPLSAIGSIESALVQSRGGKRLLAAAAFIPSADRRNPHLATSALSRRRRSQDFLLLAERFLRMRRLCPSAVPAPVTRAGSRREPGLSAAADCHPAQRRV